MWPIDDDTRAQWDDPDPIDISLAEDRLDGAGAIAEFLFGTDSRENRKKVYRLPKHPPIGRLGRKLVASKIKLSVWHDNITNASVANSAILPDAVTVLLKGGK